MNTVTNNRRTDKSQLNALEALKHVVAENSIPERAIAARTSVGKAVADKLKTLKNGQSMKFDMEVFSYPLISNVVQDLNKSEAYIYSKFHTTTLKDKGLIYVWLNPIN